MDENPTSTTTNDDASEWNDVGLDFLSDKGIENPTSGKEQETINEQDNDGAESTDSKPDESTEDDDATKKPGEEDDTTKQSEGDGKDSTPKPDSEPPKKPDEASKPDEQPPEQQQPTPEQQEALQRRTQLELEADRKELAKDVRQKIFSDVPDRLEDADGDPIETIQDVMQLKNPNTGQRFTAEEAAQYLLQAQRHFDKKQTEMREQVDEIVEVNMNIKEQADAVVSEYGEILQYMPKLRQRLWNQFKATLGTDESGEVFTKMPLSMKEFYDNAMVPYVKQVRELQAQAETEEQQKAREEAEKKKKAAEQEKRQSQSDREDVFSTRTKISEGMDSEEREWAEVAKEHYEA